MKTILYQMLPNKSQMIISTRLLSLLVLGLLLSGCASPLIPATPILRDGTSTSTINLPEKKATDTPQITSISTEVTTQDSRLTPQPMQVSPTISIEKVGQIGGMAGPLAILNDYAYLGTGDRLTVLSLTNPSNLQVVGQSESLPVGLIAAMASEGSYLYLSGGNVLMVLDLTEPTLPYLIGTLEIPDTCLSDLVIEGSYVYATGGEEGLLVIDIHNPATPRLVGTSDTPGQAIAVDIEGGYAFVADADWSYQAGGLRVVDISDPTLPKLVTPFKLQGIPDLKHVIDVEVVGEYAYLAAYDGENYNDGLRVIDISNPLDPRQVGRGTGGPVSWEGLTVVGDYVLAYGSFCHLGECFYDGYGTFFDVSDPTIPQITNHIDVPGLSSSRQTGKIVVLAGLIYQATQTGLEVWNPDSPDRPKVDGIDLTLGRVDAIFLSDRHAYLSNSQHKLTVVDVYDPAQPVKTGELTLSDHDLQDGFASLISSLAVEEDYVYLTLWNDGLAVVDVSAPSQPQEVAHLALDGDLDEIFVSDGYAYIAGFFGPEQGNVLIIDINNPSAPREIGFFSAEYNYIFSEYAFYGGVFYALTSTCLESGDCRFELCAFADLPKAGEPQILGSLLLPDDVMNFIGVVNGYAYIEHCAMRLDYTCSSKQLLIVDVSNPAFPRQVGVFVLPESGGENQQYYSVDEVSKAVYGDQLVIDVSDPIHPRIAGSSSDLEGRKVIGGGYIYVAGGKAGLLTLKVIPLAASDP